MTASTRRASLPRRLWSTALFSAMRAQERRRSWLDPDALERLQARRVRRIVSHAYATVPFYREAMDARGLRPGDIACASELSRLPLVTGDDLAAAPDRFRSTRFPPGRALEIVTTGTSGRVKRIAHDDRALLAAFAAGARWQRVVSRLAGVRGQLRTLSIVPPEGTWRALAEWWNGHTLRAPRRRGGVHSLSVATPVAKVVETINSVRPDVIAGFGSAIGHAYRWARHHRSEIWRPRLVQYGGDHLPEPDRELLRDGLGIPVVSIYQACEALMIAVQCERCEGLHVSADLVHLRVADPEGRDVPHGQEGGIVISNLVNRATVLLNYRLGDRGVLSGRPCPCGRTLPVLERLSGRADDLLVRRDGERVHESLVLKGLHEVPGVLEVRVVQHSVSDVDVALVAAPDHAGQTVARAVEAALHRLLGSDPTVTVRAALVPEIAASEGGKRRMVVSECAGTP